MPRRKPSIIAPEGIDITEQGVKPTPETVRKHRKTSFARMCERQDGGVPEITGDMLRAAQEIEMVYLGLTRGVLVKQPSLGRVDGGSRADLSERVAHAFHARYRPWANELSRRMKRGGPRALETVIDVVIDGYTLADVEDARRWAHGFAKYLVRRSLLEYAVMARWVPLGALDAFDRGHGQFARRAA